MADQLQDPESSHVFHRSPAPLIATRAEGAWVYDSEGRGYLDAAGGALVVNVGHGVAAVVGAAGSSGTLDYVHPTVFTSEALEAYAAELSPLLPMDRPRIYPTSGGAESVETALKMARAYHIARGDDRRDTFVSRRQSYHGNTVGALDVSGKLQLRNPYQTWLGRSLQVPEVNEYRCPNPDHPDGCASWHAAALEIAIGEIGEDRVAAFIAEPVGGATLGATSPPDGYWRAVAEVCKRHGVLLIADEVMTGFGRTGKWFAMDHYGVRPDLMVSGKGASGGYWPLGLCIASGPVYDTIGRSGGFTHGFTFSHSPTGAAIGRAVLEELQRGELVQRAARIGETLMRSLETHLADAPTLGDIRGVGLLIGLEFVADRDTKLPFPREQRFVERLTVAARDLGLLVYPSTGCVDGYLGDCVVLGPPFTISDDEVALIVERLGEAIRRVGP